MIKTETAEVFRLNEEVLVIQFKTDQLVKLVHAQRIDEALIELSEGKDMFVVVDALGINSNMNSEAQKYLANQSEYSRKTRAVAIVLNNLPIRLTASIFVKFVKKTFPARTFTSQDAALSWFKELY
jgi:hypothetical protein